MVDQKFEPLQNPNYEEITMVSWKGSMFGRIMLPSVPGNREIDAVTNEL